MADKFYLPPHIPRDGRDRPLIVPTVDGVPDLTAKRVSYTRASSLSDKIEDKTALGKWRERIIINGLLRQQNLLQDLSLLFATEVDPLLTHKSDLAALLDRAFAAGGGETAAAIGTNFHKVTQYWDTGELTNIEALTPELQNGLRAYIDVMKPFSVEATEMFVVNDQVRAAGTLDRLLRLPDGRVAVADIKTGKDHLYPTKAMCQCATYSHGSAYDVQTGERYPIHNDLDPTVGFLISVSLSEGRAKIYEMDLEYGWHRALTAATVRDLPTARGKLTAWENVEMKEAV